MKYYNISIIGSGNLAWHLAQDLEKAGHNIKEIFSRHLEHAEMLTDQLYDTVAKDDLNFTQSEAELIIIAVPDDAIAEVVEQLTLPPNCVVAHTSGSQPMHALSLLGNHIGVLYPLQSFTMEWPVDFMQVPVFIESSDEATRRLLMDVARSIAKNIYELTSEKRRILHLAAVMSSNYINHLLYLAQDIMETEELDIDWLRPLVNETIAKGFKLGFYEAQTGPARRKDYSTIEQHMALLAGKPAIANIYKTLTYSIITHYNNDSPDF